MTWPNRAKKRIYLDYAAATPVRKEVFSAMQPYLSDVFGNPSAIHEEGARAMEAVEEARGRLARTLRVRATDITFTSGGTEANDLALRGAIGALVANGRKLEEIEIISTKIEHPSILKTLEALEQQGIIVRCIALTEEGRVDQKAFREALSENTALVTFAYANSEVGTIEDVKGIARIVRKFNQEHGSAIKVHTDASQAPLWIPLEVDALGIDLMTLDAGKCYGPKGVGVLVHRHGTELTPQLLGGGQESGLRAGTENVPLVVGGVEALVHAQESWKSRSEAVASLRDFMIDLLEKEIDGAVLNGSREYRIANNVNISIPGIDSEYAVVKLDVEGVAASTKSACGGKKGGGSTVVLEMTGDAARAASTIRFSLGEETTKADLERAVSTLKAHVEQMRNSNFIVIDK